MSQLVLVSLIGELGYGGSERQLYLLQTHLDPVLFERHVVVFNPSNYDVYNTALEEQGIKVWLMPAEARRPHQRFLYLVRLFRKLRADIVHSWTVHDNPYAGLAGRMAGVRVRWGSLRGSLFSPGMQALPSFYRYLSLHAVSRIVVNAQSLVDQLVSQSYPEANIVLLPNVVADLSREKSADLTSFNITSTDKVVGIVGNLRRVKNHPLFVKAIAQLHRQNPTLKAVIIGQEIADELDTRDALLALIAQLGMQDTIHWLGFRADVPQLLRRLDLFCLTSDSEGMSNAVLEAMSAGCPVVVTQVGAMSEFIRDGENGYLVAPNALDQLADRIGRLLANPTHAQQLAVAGQTTVRESFGCQTVAAQLTKLYLEATGRE